MSIDRRTLLSVGAALASTAIPPVNAQSDRPKSVDWAAALIAAAMAQVGVTTVYDPAYQRIPFPGGDVARERGVCTDVVVRAYRDAFSLDLQALVNADMRAYFALYPTRWGLKKPDANIDHRRVPNLRVFLRRQGAERPVPQTMGDWQAGDIVTQELDAPGSARAAAPHIGIVSETMATGSSRRLVIHNIGAGTCLEDILEMYRVTGRYRWLPPDGRG